MKDIKHIREQYNIVTDKFEAEDNKFSSLVESGLLDESKVTLVQRALDKNPEDMTVAERKAIVHLAENFILEKLADVKRDYLTKFDPRQDRNFKERDMPYIVVLKRKGVRIFGDNQKIGLYYSQELDRYVSIPFTGNKGGHFGPGVMAEEMNNSYITEKKKPKSPEEEKLDKVRLYTDIVKKQKSARDAVQARRQKANMNKPIADMSTKERSFARKNALTHAVKNPSEAIPALAWAAGSLFAKKKEIKKPTKATEPTPAPAPIEPPPGKRELTPETKASLAASDAKSAATRRAKGEARRANAAKDSFKKKLTESRQLNEYSKTELALDAASTLPVIGNAISAGQAIHKAVKGDYAGAALDAAGAIPFYGNGVKAAKIGTKLVGAAAKEAKAITPVGKSSRVPEVPKKAPEAPAKSPEAPKSPEATKPEAPRQPKHPRKHLSLQLSQKLMVSHQKIRKMQKVRSQVNPKKSPSHFSVRIRRNLRRAGGAGGGGGSSAPTEKKFLDTPEAKVKAQGDIYKPELRAQNSNDAASVQTDNNQKLNKANRALLTKESVISQLKDVSKMRLSEATIIVDGNKVTINSIIANKIVNVYESVDSNNKKKIDNMLNESVDSFKTILNFAVRQ